MRMRFRWKRWLIGWGIVAILLIIGYLAGGCASQQDQSTPISQRPRLDLRATVEARTPAPPTSTASPVPSPTTEPTTTATPEPPAATPAPLEVFTPTIEADVYATSGPSLIVFRVPENEYDFETRHIIGLDDSATANVDISFDTTYGEYIVEIASPDALETPEEDVGVFIGDTEADFCGDPQPVLTVNEPTEGARWKPTRWWCSLSAPGKGQNDIHVFPVPKE